MKPSCLDEDILLWRLIRAGDKKAFATFYSKYYIILCSYSRYYVSTEDAEEIAQDVMMWLWERRETFSPTGGMRQYLLMSVKNRCLNSLENQHSELCKDVLFFEKLDSFYESTDSYALKELEERIEKAIADLPEVYRHSFEMCRFQDKTRPEVAKELGVSLKTIDYRMTQAVKMLKISMKDYFFIVFLLSRYI